MSLEFFLKFVYDGVKFPLSFARRRNDLCLAVLHRLKVCGELLGHLDLSAPSVLECTNLLLHGLHLLEDVIAFFVALFSDFDFPLTHYFVPPLLLELFLTFCGYVTLHMEMLHGRANMSLSFLNNGNTCRGWILNHFFP